MNQEEPKLEPRVKVCREPFASCGGAKIVAVAELVIYGAFVIRDIRILSVAKDGEETDFVAWPSRRWKVGEDKYYDVAFPITAEAYREATGCILAAFEKAESRGA